MTSRSPLLTVIAVTVLLVSAQLVRADAFGVKTIELQDNNSTNFFTILELEALEVGTGSNVALNAPTVASSAGFGGPPAGAVDGNISAGCCGQLWHGINNGAQLTITLPNPTDIEKLNFFSRIGCCGDPRTDNFQVRLFDDLGTLIFQQNILGAESQSNQGTPFMIPVTGGGGLGPVPEPSTWLLLGTGLVGLLGYGWRRRKAVA